MDVSCCHVCAADHLCAGRDAAEGARAGGGSEEARHDQTAAVQVPPVGAAGGRPGAVSVDGGRATDNHQVLDQLLYLNVL